MIREKNGFSIKKIGRKEEEVPRRVNKIVNVWDSLDASIQFKPAN
jgi:hypothetical protein